MTKSANTTISLSEEQLRTIELALIFYADMMQMFSDYSRNEHMAEEFHDKTVDSSNDAKELLEYLFP
jgi:polyhydroxyalkanoate synthesis regulator protein